MEIDTREQFHNVSLAQSHRDPFPFVADHHRSILALAVT